MAAYPVMSKAENTNKDIKDSLRKIIYVNRELPVQFRSQQRFITILLLTYTLHVECMGRDRVTQQEDIA